MFSIYYCSANYIYGSTITLMPLTSTQQHLLWFMDEEGSTSAQEDTVKVKKESKSIEEAIEVGYTKSERYLNSVS